MDLLRPDRLASSQKNPWLIAAPSGLLRLRLVETRDPVIRLFLPSAAIRSKRGCSSKARERNHRRRASRIRREPPAGMLNASAWPGAYRGAQRFIDEGKLPELGRRRAGGDGHRTTAGGTTIDS